MNQRSQIEALQHAAVASVIVFAGACLWVFPQVGLGYSQITSIGGQLVLPAIFGMAIGNSSLGVTGSRSLKGGLSVFVGISTYLLLAELLVDLPDGVNLWPFAPPLEWGLPVALVAALVAGRWSASADSKPA